jgi:NADPH oxidase 2
MAMRHRGSALSQPLLEADTTDDDALTVVEEEKKPLITVEDVKDWWASDGWKTLILLSWVAANLTVGIYAAYVYWGNPNYYVTLARIGGATLNLNCALILFPVCRHTLTWVRKIRFLRDIIPFDSNIRFHKIISYTIFTMAVIHTIGHYLNYNTTGKPWTFGWTTLAGSTGHLLAFICLLIGTAAIDPVRRPNFNVFYLTHHLFIIFYALLLAHGPVFWQYFLLPGTIYTCERLYREFTARKLKTRVLSVTNHPSDVIEIKFYRKLFYYKAGQYLFLNCPYLSQWEWHPFTITSSPEEDFVSVHIRCVGDWTKGIRALLAPPTEGSQIEIGRSYGPDNKKALLRLDGPYGAASEDIFDYRVVLLVGAGIGVTPFASVLKTVFLRLRKFREGLSAVNPMKSLQKVYFFWVLREFKSFEWFREMVLQLQAELRAFDLLNNVEIHLHLTGKLKQDEHLGLLFFLFFLLHTFLSFFLSDSNLIVIVITFFH